LATIKREGFDDFKMSIFSIIAVFITLAALAGYINYRYIRLPSTIGLMVIGLGMSLLVLLIDALGIDLRTPAERFLGNINFSDALMQGMLSFLLFAGALKININDLAKEKWVVTALATVGVIISTFFIGTAMYFILKVIGLSMSYMYCLIFGALISPTDPVAVLAVLKSVGAPKKLETKIAGESLFNDGVGVVVFIVLVSLAAEGGGHGVSVGEVLLLFVEEALGGVVFGVVIGYIAYRLLKKVDDHSVEVLLTLALVCGGYALAREINTSGPIAVVVAGLLIGNYGRALAMSEKTRDHLDKFWNLVDEILNAVLFVWIGFEMLVLAFGRDNLFAGLLAIPVILLARLVSVSTVVHTFKYTQEFSERAITILTWGGLRGGISIALALSLSGGVERDLIVSITYIVVIFSILVQGLTIKPLVQRSRK